MKISGTCFSDAVVLVKRLYDSYFYNDNENGNKLGRSLTIGFYEWSSAVIAFH